MLTYTDMCIWVTFENLFDQHLHNDKNTYTPYISLAKIADLQAYCDMPREAMVHVLNQPK